MPTATDFTNAMTSQLRLLNPAFSSNAGSPEQLILETVGGALSNATIGLNTLAGTLDISSKTGDSLDRFLALFGFARQTAAQATGFVTFTSNTPPISDIVIPANTQLYATLTSPANTTGSSTSIVYFVTQFQGTIPANSSPASVTVPIIAQIAGSSGNVAANTITSFGTAPVYGVTSVTNSTAATGGTDAETDAELQTRFQNTVFRNLAGTTDQYLGLIASTKYSTQAQVIGPVSRYQEYLQVPPVDDTQSYTVAITASGNFNVGGNGNTPGNYTSALSTVPNSQYIYTDIPNFLTNGLQGASTTFYREGIDWVLNTTPTSKNYGDAYRFWEANLPGADWPLATYQPTLFQPNVTFMNVVASGVDVQTLTPEQVVFFEHAYLSNASRNNPQAGLFNAIDIYVDGQNAVTATTNLAIPTLPLVFNNVPGTFLTTTNYQRYGEPNDPPSAGNWFFPLYSEPVIGLPSQISVTGTTASGIQTSFYALNDPTVTTTVNGAYWLVQDISDLYGTVRCRNGIEFSPTALGYLNVPGDGLGLALSAFATGTPITIAGYTYDKNIVDLQAMCDSAKQITTDVLVHQAYPRYFKLDITVVYAPGASSTVVNSSIQAAVQGYFASKTFGALIQTGSIIQTIFGVPGVQNVRWSADLPFGPEPGDNRITETDIMGNPLSPTSTDPAIFNVDFFIGDDQLAYLPQGQLTTDTLPGLIIRPRAESSWVRGPYNPTLSPGNLPIQPPD